jgi:hypothetical protein
MKKSDPNQYTKPELRDKIKDEVLQSDKGGEPGRWSARKAQIVAQEYEREGGGYKHAPSESQQHLQQWEDEHWTTSDGQTARRKGGTVRYLPEEAWHQLSDEQKRATNEKKRSGSRQGKQFVSNTSAAAKARKSASKKAAPAKTKKNANSKSANQDNSRRAA